MRIESSLTPFNVEKPMISILSDEDSTILVEKIEKNSLDSNIYPNEYAMAGNGLFTIIDSKDMLILLLSTQMTFDEITEFTHGGLVLEKEKEDSSREYTVKERYEEPRLIHKLNTYDDSYRCETAGFSIPMPLPQIATFESIPIVCVSNDNRFRKVMIIPRHPLEVFLASFGLWKGATNDGRRVRDFHLSKSHKEMVIDYIGLNKGTPKNSRVVLACKEYKELTGWTWVQRRMLEILERG